MRGRRYTAMHSILRNAYHQYTFPRLTDFSTVARVAQRNSSSHSGHLSTYTQRSNVA